MTKKEFDKYKAETEKEVQTFIEMIKENNRISLLNADEAIKMLEKRVLLLETIIRQYIGQG